MKVISGYQYQQVKNKEELRDRIKELGLSLKIKGRILIGQEGINAACSGENSAVEEFKKEIRKVFKKITFREQKVTNHTYKN